MAKAVVARYPELKVYLTQDRKWKQAHHENMFDAVAVALNMPLAGRLRKEGNQCQFQ